MLLFLSHSGADTAAAVELKRRILLSPQARDAGLQVWLDKDDLRAGGPPWQTQLSEALDQATAFCVYVGSGGVVNWVDREVQLGLSRATGPVAIPFIPVLAADVKPSALPPFACQHQAVRDPLGDPDALAELVRAALGRTEDVPLVDEPFVGLRSMDEADAHLFYGREQEVQELAGKLRRYPLVAVLADSGAGKSSLVRAGLVPAFRGGVLEPEDQPQRPGTVRHVVVMRPGGDPVEGLREGVTEAARALNLSREDRASLRRQVDLANVGETVRAIRCDLPRDTTDTLLVVDQFEELLTQAKPEEALAFVDLLLALVDPSAQRRTRVVLTVRADYFNLVSQFKSLHARLSAERGAAQFRLKGVSEKGLREIVLRPLKMAGYKDEADSKVLLRAIQRDITEKPGDLALVQMALTETWSRSGAGADRKERRSLAAVYAEVGGVMGALGNKAEHIRTSVPTEAEQALMLPLFARLVTPGDSGGATRRRVNLADLSPALQELARKLAGEKGGRLLQTSDHSAEIAHEALIGQWRWLQHSVKAVAEDIRWLARLGEGARTWRAEGTSTATLPNAALHQSFNRLRQDHPNWLSALEMAYLDAADQHVLAAEEKERADQERRKLVESLTQTQAELEGTVQDLTQTRERLESTVMDLTATRANLEGAVEDLTGTRTELENTVESLTHTRTRLRRGVQVLIGLVAIAVVLGGLAGWSSWRANRSEQFALAAQQEAVQAAWAGRRNEASALAALSTVALQGGRPVDAAKLALAAWPRNRDTTSPQVMEATVALAAVMPKLQERIVLDGQDVFITSVAFSPNGARLATGSEDGTVRLWDASRGVPVGPALEGHAGAVTSVAFSPDGTRLATGSWDDTARLWDVSTGEQVGPALEGPEDSVWSVAFSPDGTGLATRSGNGTILLWDVSTGRQVGPALARPVGEIMSVAFSPDGTRLATGSNDGTARLWDVSTGQPVGVVLEGHEDGVTSMSFSPDGTRLATGSQDSTARLWDVATGESIGPVLAGHEGGVTSVAFSTDGTRLATGSEDGTARLWDVAAGAPVGLAFEGHEGAVTSVVFSPDGTRLATRSMDGTARLWDASRGVPGGPALERHEHEVMSVAFSPDGTRLATGSWDRTVRLWDVSTGRQVGPVLEGLDGPIYSVAFSPDGTRLAKGSSDGTVRLWDVSTGTQVGPALEGHVGQVASVAFAPDGTRLATGSLDSTARLWDVSTGAQVGPVLAGHEGPVASVAFAPDGTRLATGSLDSTARLWDVSTGAQVGPVLAGHGGFVISVAFSPDGTRLATGSEDSTARLWDVSTGAPVGPVLVGHVGAVTSVAFSPDGTRLATGSNDGTAQLWDVSTGAAVGEPLGGHEAWITSVAFSPVDGTRLATGSADGTARLWDVSGVPKGSAFEIACSLLPLRNGQPDTELASALGGTSIEITEPICGPDYDPPLPWWSIPGATEPQPPGLENDDNPRE